MLWQKGWFETRLRVLFSLGIICFMLYMATVKSHGPRQMEALLQATVPGAMMVFCAMLSGAGIVTQPPFQTTKGTHGSMLYTLSLPVTRLRLLAVRASIGWLELAALTTILCTGVWFTSSAVRAATTPFTMVEFAVTLVVCASALYSLSVLLATFLEDQWRIWGTMICSVGLALLSHNLNLPASLDIFQAVSTRSPILLHAMPWPAMAFAVFLSAAFLTTALKIAQSREY